MNDRIISGMCLVSEAVWGGYPFVESITSFLPVVDEIVVIYNAFGRDDGTFEQLAELRERAKPLPIRIIRTEFSIEKHGWATYGLARTLGYQAVKGDIVLMFDVDGVLHENQVDLLKSEIQAMASENSATGYWEKHRIYKPNLYYPQHKHSGIYNKRILGDRLDFLRADGKGAPNFDQLTPQEQRSKKFSTTLFGYEHVWDLEEVIRYKTTRYGEMLDVLHGEPTKTSDEYWKIYMDDLIGKLSRDGLNMPLEKHPAIMRERIDSLDEKHFGFNFFNYTNET